MVENDPFCAIFYTETLLRGNFNNVLITDCLELKNKFSPENLMYDYFENVPIEMDHKKFKERQKKRKQTDDLRLLKHQSITKEDNFQKQFISYILQEFEVDTTVIVLDTESFEMVRTYLSIRTNSTHCTEIFWVNFTINTDDEWVTVSQRDLAELAGLKFS